MKEIVAAIVAIAVPMAVGIALISLPKNLISRPRPPKRDARLVGVNIENLKEDSRQPVHAHGD